jgi:methyltransferase
MMTPQLIVAAATLVAVMLMMLAEQQLSAFNARSLRSLGAIEPPDDVYPMMAFVYPLAFVIMSVEGAFFGPAPWMGTLAGGVLFGLAKAWKFWAIASLGPRWTFRVLVLPDAPLVHHGPYAMMRHPNYLGVLGEVAGVALLVGARFSGPLSMLAMAMLLKKRVAVEERALNIH